MCIHMYEVDTLWYNYPNYQKKCKIDKKHYKQYKQPFRQNNGKFYKKIFLNYKNNKQKIKKAFEKGKKVYKRNKTCKYLLCWKEEHIKPYCPKNKRVNQLEINSYNIEEQVSGIEEIFNIDKISNNDSICILSKYSSE